MIEDISFEKLGVRFLNGDPEAAQQVRCWLCKEFGRWASANYRLSHQEIEDVAQETIFHVWRSRHRLQEVLNLRSWFWGTARNVARNRVRSRKRQKTIRLPSHIVASSRSPLEERELRELFLRALANLPEIYRQVLELTCFENLRPREVASRLGVSVSIVYMRLHRGRVKLRERIGHLLAHRR